MQGSYSLYEGTVTHATASLNALLHFFTKMEEYATAKSTSVDELIQARLAPDMLPFAFQVHVVTDASMKMVARVQGTEPITWDVPEWEGLKTIADLRNRVNAALELFKGADKAKFEERVDATVTCAMGPKSYDMKAREYVAGYSLPNIFFHTVTAYNILRHKGLELGKRDYLTPYIGAYLTGSQ
eukprot:TRINITY_DN145_c0_g1_i1.p1 TRINITY_DN145_c0_g1~~TRINITY_DN145_c0_g1_i1.p1  ORF type:complete len:198 (-),score=39.85 TRINITY_DN145_c0_g1_i1:83-634(-)